MEIRINKEIKDYHEGIFMGLSMRQCVCSAIAIAVALGVYFGLRNILGRETVSWLCVVCAAPFAAAGFFKYNGMNFEQFVKAYIRSEFLASGVRKFESENFLYNLCKEGLADGNIRKKKNKKAKKKDTEDSSAVDTDRYSL